MDVDDLEPRRDLAQLRNLDPLSIRELQAYIAELEAEILRARAAILAKNDVRSGAESLFRK